MYDVGSSAMSLVGKFCGEQFTWTIISKSNSLQLKLVGVDWIEGEHQIVLEYTIIGN